MYLTLLDEEIRILLLGPINLKSIRASSVGQHRFSSRTPQKQALEIDHCVYGTESLYQFYETSSPLVRARFRVEKNRLRQLPSGPEEGVRQNSYCRRLWRRIQENSVKHTRFEGGIPSVGETTLNKSKFKVVIVKLLYCFALKLQMNNSYMLSYLRARKHWFFDLNKLALNQLSQLNRYWIQQRQFN